MLSGTSTKHQELGKLPGNGQPQGVRVHQLPFWLSRHRMFIGTILALTAQNAINIRPLWGQLYAYPLITKFHLKNYTFFLCP
jgi:hypothetical protein